MQEKDIKLRREISGAYNVGPDEENCWTTGDLVDCFCNAWGEGASWVNQNQGGPHEAGLLKLDCTKLKNTFCWKPQWDIKTSVENVVEWTRSYQSGCDVRRVMEWQIERYLEVPG